MALPTFAIIGAMKCGTTSVHHYLQEHPEIQMPVIKETNFFSGPADGIPYPPGSKRIEDLKTYEQLFDPTYRVRGEASPCYTLYPRRKGTPERISALMPEAKLIYLVRDPVARALSQYHFSVSVEAERRSVHEALKDLSDPNSLYTCPGFYAVQIEQYLHYFRQDQILVVDQADLLARRRDTLQEMFAFLEVDSSFVSPVFDEEKNTGDEQRTYSKFIVLQRRAQASPLVHRLPRRLRRFARQSIEKVVSRPLEKPILDDDLQHHLRAVYSSDVTRLRELTGKRFPTWSL
ncbi:MAG: sulfotransferase [Solirubrobacteraceae bacterium]